MDTRTDDITSSLERLTHAIDECLADLHEACGDNKQLYLEKAYAVISGFNSDLEDSMGYSNSSLDRPVGFYDPDDAECGYEDGDDWDDEDDDWNDFGEEDEE